MAAAVTKFRTPWAFSSSSVKRLRVPATLVLGLVNLDGAAALAHGAIDGFHNVDLAATFGTGLALVDRQGLGVGRLLVGVVAAVVLAAPRECDCTVVALRQPST